MRSQRGKSGQSNDRSVLRARDPIHAGSVLTKYGPKEALSPSIGTECPVCGVAFQVGDYTALVRTTKHSTYGDHRIEVHWSCATTVPE